MWLLLKKITEGFNRSLKGFHTKKNSKHLNNKHLINNSMIYEIGGNEVKMEVSEAFAEIAPNRTLFVQQLTNEAPLNPLVIEGLQTTEEVFAHFKPTCSIEFETEDGQLKKEDLNFKNLGEFSALSITERSSYLNNINNEQIIYSKMIKQLKSNKALQVVIDNTENKATLIAILNELIKELEETKN